MADLMEDRLYPMRLQKFLARAGVASRRGSENLMTAGRVRVNGEVVTELGSKVDPNTDTVTVDGNPVSLEDGAVVIMLNKPAGYVTTMSDPQGRPCVADLVPTDRYPGLYPLGRLDNATTGLLLFSTDGDLGNALLRPRHHVDKTYIATVQGKPSEKIIRRMEAGLELQDGPTLPALVRMIEPGRETSVLSITIHEGRNRQVRRMFKAVRHPVLQLHRSSFGPLELGDLPSGEWKIVEGEPLEALYRAARESMLE